MNHTGSARPRAFASSIGYWSDVGKSRSENEDHVYVPPNLSPQAIQAKGFLCLVADGMGGHAKGEVASEMAVRRIAEEYYADPNPDPESSLRRAIQTANAEIFAAAQRPELARMGTTIVAAVSLGNQVIVANVGDSRAYLISQRRAFQITRDHSWVQDRVDEGVLTEEQAQQHAQKNLITRALGSHPTVEVDTYRPAAEPGDWVLLCSDGLSGVLGSEEIARTASQLPPPAAAKELVAQANARGGPDNISVVILPALASGGSVSTAHARTTAVPILLSTSGIAIVGILLIFMASIISRSHTERALRVPPVTVTGAVPTILLTSTAPTLTSQISLPPILATPEPALPTTTSTRQLPTHASLTPTASPSFSANQPVTPASPNPTPSPFGAPLHYTIKPGQYAANLAGYFTGKPEAWQDFLWRHRSEPNSIISTDCSNTPASTYAPKCLQSGGLLVMEWAELNPVPFTEVAERPAEQPLWLVGNATKDGWPGIVGTKELFSQVPDGRHILLRVKHDQGKITVLPLEIKPKQFDDIIFVWNEGGYFGSK